MSFQETALIIGLGITSVGAIFSVYDRFSKPDIKSAEKVALLEQGCLLKHKGIDEKFTSINNELTFIKDNHLKHIEADVRGLSDTQIKILTILKAVHKIDIE